MRLAHSFQLDVLCFAVLRLHTAHTAKQNTTWPGMLIVTCFSVGHHEPVQTVLTDQEFGWIQKLVRPD